MIIEADLYVVGQFIEEINSDKEAYPVVGIVIPFLVVDRGDHNATLTSCISSSSIGSL